MNGVSFRVASNENECLSLYVSSTHCLVTRRQRWHTNQASLWLLVDTTKPLLHVRHQSSVPPRRATRRKRSNSTIAHSEETLSGRHTTVRLRRQHLFNGCLVTVTICGRHSREQQCTRHAGGSCAAQCADGADRRGRPSGGQQLTDSSRRCADGDREKKGKGATNRAQHHLSSLQTYSRAQWGKHRDTPVLQEAAVLQGMRHRSHNKGLQAVPALHKEIPSAARLQNLSRIGD